MQFMQKRTMTTSSNMNNLISVESGIADLRLVADPSVDQHTRESALVNLKSQYKTLSDASKQDIKKEIVDMMLSSHANPDIQVQLIEIIAVIGNQDFPRSWPDLLPDLKSRLEKAMVDEDRVSVDAILATLNSVFMKLRCLSTSHVRVDLKYSIDNFAAPLLDIAERISNKIISDAYPHPLLIGALNSCFTIFYSLSHLHSHVYFGDNFDKWMLLFKRCLSSDHYGLLGVAVCDNLTFYMSLHYTMFKNYVDWFFDAVWSRVSSYQPLESFAVSAFKFLTFVTSYKNHRALISMSGIKMPDFLIPNLMVRYEEVELSNSNYRKFISRDMNPYTRRKLACALIGNIALHHEENVTKDVSDVISHCLELFNENPTDNWKYKDCAIRILVYLGASLTSSVVDVESFFTSVIVPVLQGKDVYAFPFLKVAALKFFSTFCFQMPKPLVMAHLADVLPFLTSSDSNVLHSYAANCIYNILLLEDIDWLRASHTASDVLSLLMVNVIRFFVEPRSSEPNPFIMRCIMAAVRIADLSSNVPRIVTDLGMVLHRACDDNTKDLLFNRCLLDAVATLVHRACEKNDSHVLLFNKFFFPTLEPILAIHKEAEFFPYALQLLAQLVYLNQPPVTPNYMRIFDIILQTHDMWKVSSNITDLLCLLHSFLHQATPDELNSNGRLKAVLLISTKLVSSPRRDVQGFHILNLLIEKLGYDVIAEYMIHIWSSTFARLQDSQTRTPRLVSCMFIFMSRFLVKHGMTTLVDSIDSIQADFFHVILSKFWIPNVKTIDGSCTEVKFIAVASSYLLCEYPSLLDPASQDLWGKLLDGIVTLLTKPKQENVKQRIKYESGFPCYHTSYVRAHSDIVTKDPIEEIKDPKGFLVALLAKHSAQFRDSFPPVITKYLAPDNQAALVQLCESYDLATV